MTTDTLSQGQVQPLDHAVARRLLRSTELASLADAATGSKPRLFPMLSHRNAKEATFAESRKIAALQARPEVAGTTDHRGPPPQIALGRGHDEAMATEDVVPEYAGVGVPDCVSRLSGKSPAEQFTTRGSTEWPPSH
ncbi:pyridoxamine 5'-phosphate oxidase [Amycolatopsis acidicola]|uniref:Pyridoxamine 5'-phosphate oxidase n=1 Tax=Amycolatopsis acidicola TaxID=2596893 RepID=A0A5N0UUF3_9PSEU|nr:pyridoxamine 5'-phosphate oxidase [Amycolatopsis acidicola]KAA9153866.1 pyridoxamine 5'-phosphate oxidase [Amycolatopsis acidicola]